MLVGPVRRPFCWKEQVWNRNPSGVVCRAFRILVDAAHVHRNSDISDAKLVLFQLVLYQPPERILLDSWGLVE